MINKKIIIVFLSVFLAIVVAGCSRGEVVPPGNDLSTSEPVGVGDNEAQPVVTGVPDEAENSKGFPGFSEEYLNKEYGSFAEAYLDILTANHSVLTNELLSDIDMGMGLDIGDGYISVKDVFGDETPELLCVYIDIEADTEIIGAADVSRYLKLKIISFSETEGTESVFDNVIYTFAGGEHNYCVYFTHSGELMMFLWSSGVAENGGFWPIIPIQNMEYDPYPHDGFDYPRDLAALYYIVGMPENLYMQFGKKISIDQFNKASKEILGNIDSVLFQGAVLGNLGLRLYKDVELWKAITPFEAENMTYTDAVSWLEAQIANQ